MPSISPHSSTVAAAMPASPHGGSAAKRPAMLNRGSSQSSMSGLRRGGDGMTSPGAGNELHHQQQNNNYHYQQQPARQHHVKPAKHAKIILPRNHSSGRNLAKLARQASQQQQQQHQQNAGATAGTTTGGIHFDLPSPAGRGRSAHDGDTDIRLPGSLDESRPAPPPMRRNLTAYNLPRNASHSKLKKNLSHGQLTRLGSGKNLVGLMTAAAAAGGTAGSKGPPSPGIKGKSRRHKSIDAAILPSAAAGEKDLHQQEVELAEEMERRRKEGVGARTGTGLSAAGAPSAHKKVGFAVGSFNSGSDDEGDGLQMEGSGLQDDDWEDQSGSASPETTRQNTANNSRRTSVDFGKSAEQRRGTQFAGGGAGSGGAGAAGKPKEPAPVAVAVPSDEEDSGAIESSEEEDKDEDEDEEEDDQATPPSTPAPKQGTIPQIQGAATVSAQSQPPAPASSLPSAAADTEIDKSPPLALRPRPARQSSAYSGRDVSNPTTNLLGRTGHSVAPALVSNVSAMDDTHSSMDSTSASLMSSRSNLGDSTTEQDPDELVSRFIPSSSHPSTGSAGNSVANTLANSTLAGTTLGNNSPLKKPAKHSGTHTPENESMSSANHNHNHDHHNHHRGSGKNLSALSRGGSPGSTLSGSSAAPTPAFGMSRTELRLKNEKFMADMEDAAAMHPPFPPHRYDRRNESLKSYLNLAALQASDARSIAAGGAGGGSSGGLSLGPEIFQGRFKAVNTELKVVQKFHDPLAGSFARLLKCRTSAPSKRAAGGKSPFAPSVKGPSSSSAAANAASAVAGATGSAASKALQTSKSALALSRQATAPSSSKLSTSVSPPNRPDSRSRDQSGAGGGLATSKSSSHIARHPGSGADNAANEGRLGTAGRGGSGRVSFPQTTDARGEAAGANAHALASAQQQQQQRGRHADVIARRLWDAVGA